MRGGYRMHVPRNSAQSWQAAFTATYDDEELELLRTHVEPGSVVLDVGASLGFYTVPLALAARRTGGRVVAVEPVGANCDVIRRNVELNGLQGVVTVVPVALGARREEVVLHVETGGTGNATIVSDLDPREVERHDRDGGTGATEAAQVHRLDDLDPPALRPQERCSLVKIDAEGFEMGILAGATAFIDANRPVIHAEFHPAWLRTRGVDAAAPQRWAADHGYDCAELVYHRVHPASDRRRISLRPLPSPATARSGSGLLLVPRPADGPSSG